MTPPRRGGRSPSSVRCLAGTVLVCIGLLGCGGAAAGDPPVSRALLERIMYVEAERAIRRGATSKFRRLASRIESHPLHPWLRYLEFRRDFGRRSDAEIEAFLAEHAATPVADRVRLLWIDRLARQGRWQPLLEVYAAIPPGLPEARHDCLRARALLETGRDKEGFSAAAELWRVPRSQDAACDRAFSLWVGKKGRTQEHLWDRIELAMRYRNQGLAGYVARRLPAADRAIVQRWIRDRGRPERIVARAGRVAREPGWRIPVSASIAALARRRPAPAARAWRAAVESDSVPPELDAFASWRIGLGFAQEHRFPEALLWIERVPAAGRHERLLGMEALLSFAERRWERGIASLDALPDEARGELRWRYWRARMLEALGRKKAIKSSSSSIVRSSKRAVCFSISCSLKVRKSTGNFASAR